MPATPPTTPAVATKYCVEMIYPDHQSISEDDVLEIVRSIKTITEPKDQVEIVLLVNSRGGSAYAAVKIIEILRTKCNKLTMVIPMRAKSAATLMALGCDEVVMGPQSELGPLDKPIEHPDVSGISLSALDVINSIDYLEKRAKSHIKDLTWTYYSEFGLSKKDALNAATIVGLGLVTPILGKEDPRMVNQALRLLLIAEKYGYAFLEKYMFKNDSSKKSIIPTILKVLIWQYPDHGYAITRREAKSLLLNIVDAEGYTLWDTLWDFYLKTRKNEKNQYLYIIFRRVIIYL